MDSFNNYPENSSKSICFQVIDGNALGNYTNAYHFTLLVNKKGRCTLVLEDAILKLEENNVLLVSQKMMRGVQLKTEGECLFTLLSFNNTFLTERLLAVKEFRPMAEAIEKCDRVLFFEALPPLQKLIDESNFKDSFSSIGIIFKILDLLGRTAGRTLLQVKPAHDGLPFGQHDEKIAKVLMYTEEHFREQISLKAIAELINFTETSFCRYFKSQTGKTYFQYLVEMRIARACKLLLESSTLAIEEVCFSTGFNNPSNFYKQFKKIMRLTPREYQLKGKKTSDYKGSLVA
jgi:AraC-like DNA-binding protein